MSYAVSINAINDTEADQLLDQCYEALLDMADVQSELTEAEDPALKYLTIISTLIAQNKAYLMGPVYEIDEDGTEKRAHIGMGGTEKLGWHDGSNVYLLPGAYNAVCRYAHTEGWAFPSDEATLRKELARGGYLSRTDNGRTTTRRREPGANSAPVHVIALSIETIGRMLVKMGVECKALEFLTLGL